MPSSRKRTAQPKATGNCFEAAGQYMMDRWLSGQVGDLRLVHGEVAGQAHLAGMTFGHAWILDGEDIIDVSNGRNIRMPKAAYYALGQIDRIGNTHEYPWEEARKLILQHQHWGPWELKTQSGF